MPHSVSMDSVVLCTANSCTTSQAKPSKLQVCI